jgi:hypothetical protein
MEGNFMLLTKNEKMQLDDVFHKINKLKNYLDKETINQSDKIEVIFKYINGIKNIQGNFNNSINPHQENDFGAAQKTSFRNDFKKLNETKADYKYLFVTEEKSFEILKNKYISELKNIKIILLEC